MGGSSEQQQSSSSTTTTRLPGNQQRNVDTLLQGALDYYNSGGRTFFPGDTVANFNPLQQEGQGSLLDFARGGGQDYVNAAMAGNQFLMDPNMMLNPQNIPGYAAGQEATSRMYTDNLLENILPTVRGGGTASGQFGGSASGIGQALAVNKSNQSLADALTMMDLGAYTQGLSAMQNATANAPNMFALGAQPGSIIAGVGDANQQQQQREIDAEIARHMFQQNEPLNVLNALKMLTGSAGEYGGTVDQKGESTTTQSGGSPLSQALGLGLMGASMMGGPAGMAGKGAASGAMPAAFTASAPTLPAIGPVSTWGNS